MRILLLVLLLASSAFAQEVPPDDSVGRGLYGDVQMLWFDSPIKSYQRDVYDEAGTEEFAPRMIVGYDDVWGVRARWWTYDRTTTLDGIFEGPGNERLAFDVVDLEATTRVGDFLISGGARIAKIEAREQWESFVTWESGTVAGITLAAEGRTMFVEHFAAVYGGRLSMLEGGIDGGSDSGNIHLGSQNERFVVPEVFAGVEATYGRAFTRLTVELQDWQRSDRGNDGHDFAFTGYGFDVGIAY